MTESLMGFSEFRDYLMHRTNLTPDKIYALWKASDFDKEAPTRMAVDTLIMTVKIASYDSVMMVLTDGTAP